MRLEDINTSRLAQTAAQFVFYNNLTNLRPEELIIKLKEAGKMPENVNAHRFIAMVRQILINT